MSGLKRTYRRIIIKNYIILYTIDEKNRKIFVSHMYYSGKNYESYHVDLNSIGL